MSQQIAAYQDIVDIKMLGQLLLAIALCSVVSASRVYLELGQQVTPPVEKGWRIVRRCWSSDSIVLTFALKLRNVDELKKIFQQVSTPGSLKYREHMSLEDLATMTAPNKHEKERVQSWLQSEGVGVEETCRATFNGDFLKCSVPCWLAEQLLDTQFFEYANSYNDSVMRANKLYSVPSDVAPFIDFVGGTHHFPPTERQRRHVALPALGVTPHLLRQHYNVSDKVGEMTSNKQAVAQFLNQHYSEVDLKEFFLLYGESFTHKDSVDKIVGPNSGLSGAEASLDIQYIMSLGANISTWFWSTPGLHSGQEPFLEWIMAVGNTTDVPSVFSVSYGDDEDSLSTSYMERINAEFMKLGSRGITILFASGDDGTGCNGKTFVPSFPASSPYVTTVGGTEFKDIFGLGGSEIGNMISGGGFSAVFTQPSYQAVFI
jgi:tripeptidyl-peptidase-1